MARTNPTVNSASENQSSAGARIVTLAELYSRPLQISLPEGKTAPFIFASPHSGRHYPDSLVAGSSLAPNTLRQSEDAYVDQLFSAASGVAPMIAAHFPRVFLDVNRDESELDPDMFDGPLTLAITPTARVMAGLGVIPRVVRENVIIQRHRLSPLEAHERLERLYRPYHKALATLVTEAQSRFGTVLVVDCHSMPSAGKQADIVLGDRFGTSVPEKLLRKLEINFAAQGFSVARNDPYAGGYTTALYSHGETGIFAVQIEVNRALYLNENQVQPLSTFESVRARITAALEHILRCDISRLCSQVPRMQSRAAE